MYERKRKEEVMVERNKQQGKKGVNIKKMRKRLGEKKRDEERKRGRWKKRKRGSGKKRRK